MKNSFSKIHQSYRQAVVEKLRDIFDDETAGLIALHCCADPGCMDFARYDGKSCKCGALCSVCPAKQSKRK